jgi:hypothetical protein
MLVIHMKVPLVASAWTRLRTSMLRRAATPSNGATYLLVRLLLAEHFSWPPASWMAALANNVQSGRRIGCDIRANSINFRLNSRGAVRQSHGRSSQAFLRLFRHRMSLDNPILVTGAAGNLGGVGRTVVELRM